MRILLLMVCIALVGKVCSQTVYKFTGKGRWSDTANWENKKVPPDILLQNAEIIVDPAGDSDCVLDYPQYFSADVKLTVARGKKLVLRREITLGNLPVPFLLSEDDLNFLDSISVPDPTTIEVVNRQQRSKDDPGNLVDKMLQHAKELSDKKKPLPANLNPEGVPEKNGVNVPAHYGYAYRWGTNKDISMRHYANTKEADATHKADSVVGTDCEGFMYDLLKEVKITMVPAGSREFARSLNGQLQTKTNRAFNDLRLDSIGDASAHEKKSGDVIVWKKKGHIGIVTINTKDQKVFVYNSHGNPTPEKTQTDVRGSKTKRKKTVAEEQAANYGPERGIHPIAYTDAISWFGPGAATLFRFTKVEVTTTPPTSLTQTSAAGGGTITYNGTDEIIEKGVCWNQTGLPDINNDPSAKGEGQQAFTSTIQGLTDGKTYKVRAYVTIRNKGQKDDKGVTYYGNEETYIPGGETVKDIDGNIYHTVKIGTQTWLIEDLRVTHYNDGVPIEHVTNDAQWGSPTAGYYCYAENKPANKSTYGCLYNWLAVDSRKLAPAGWRVPTDKDWEDLQTYLGGRDIAGGKLKEAGTTHWAAPNEGATNASGFTALPGGFRGDNGSFLVPGETGVWWSATTVNGFQAYYWSLGYSIVSLFHSFTGNRVGMSVRCIKDE